MRKIGKKDSIIIVYKPSTLAYAKKIAQHCSKKVQKVICYNRDHITQKVDRSSLCIVVGGDGTFLRAARHIHKNTPLFGINPQPTTTEGFFTHATPQDAMQKLGQVFEGKYVLMELNRLRAELMVKGVRHMLPLSALNEICFTNKSSYEMSRYKLFGEFQKSSGVLVSTAAGSNAWIKSAGGKGQPLQSGNIQFLVREPYHGKLSHASKLHGIIPGSRKIHLVSEMKNGILVFDSLKPALPISHGTQVTITSSKEKLLVVAFGQ